MEKNEQIPSVVSQLRPPMNILLKEGERAPSKGKETQRFNRRETMTMGERNGLD